MSSARLCAESRIASAWEAPSSLSRSVAACVASLSNLLAGVHPRLA